MDRGAAASELTAFIRLLLLSVAVLPDRDLGPGGALNPYVLWWLVIATPR